MLQCADLACINVNAVRGNDLGFEQAQFLDVWNDRHALFFAHVLNFKGSFRDVNVQRHIEFFGEVYASADNFRVGGVGGMWSNGGHNQRMSLPLFDELARIGKRVIIRWCIRRGVFHNRLTAHGAHTCISGGLSDVIFVEVHIVEGGHAAADLFGTGNESTKTHELGRNELTFHRQHIAHQPHVKTQVISETADEGHGHVGVGVDQTGHENFPAAVDYFFC